MVLLQNTKPKKQSQKYPKSKNLNLCKKLSLKFWTATNKKLIIPISAKLNILSSNETPMKLKNFYFQEKLPLSTKLEGGKYSRGSRVICFSFSLMHFDKVGKRFTIYLNFCAKSLTDFS